MESSPIGPPAKRQKLGTPDPSTANDNESSTRTPGAQDASAEANAAPGSPQNDLDEDAIQQNNSSPSGRDRAAALQRYSKKVAVLRRISGEIIAEVLIPPEVEVPLFLPSPGDHGAAERVGSPAFRHRSVVLFRRAVKAVLEKVFLEWACIPPGYWSVFFTDSEALDVDTAFDEMDEEAQKEAKALDGEQKGSLQHEEHREQSSEGAGGASSRGGGGGGEVGAASGFTESSSSRRADREEQGGSCRDFVDLAGREYEDPFSFSLYADTEKVMTSAPCWRRRVLGASRSEEDEDQGRPWMYMWRAELLPKMAKRFRKLGRVFKAVPLEVRNRALSAVGPEGDLFVDEGRGVDEDEVRALGEDESRGVDQRLWDDLHMLEIDDGSARPRDVEVRLRVTDELFLWIVPLWLRIAKEWFDFDPIKIDGRRRRGFFSSRPHRCRNYNDWEWTLLNSEFDNLNRSAALNKVERPQEMLLSAIVRDPEFFALSVPKLRASGSGIPGARGEVGLHLRPEYVGAILLANLDLFPPESGSLRPCYQREVFLRELLVRTLSLSGPEIDFLGDGGTLMAEVAFSNFANSWTDPRNGASPADFLPLFRLPPGALLNRHASLLVDLFAHDTSKLVRWLVGLLEKEPCSVTQHEAFSDDASDDSEDAEDSSDEDQKQSTSLLGNFVRRRRRSSDWSWLWPPLSAEQKAARKVEITAKNAKLAKVRAAFTKGDFEKRKEQREHLIEEQREAVLVSRAAATLLWQLAAVPEQVWEESCQPHFRKAEEILFDRLCAQREVLSPKARGYRKKGRSASRGSRPRRRDLPTFSCFDDLCENLTIEYLKLLSTLVASSFDWRSRSVRMRSCRPLGLGNCEGRAPFRLSDRLQFGGVHRLVAMLVELISRPLQGSDCAPMHFQWCGCEEDFSYTSPRLRLAATQCLDYLAGSVPPPFFYEHGTECAKNASAAFKAVIETPIAMLRQQYEQMLFGDFAATKPKTLGALRAPLLWHMNMDDDDEPTRRARAKDELRAIMLSTLCSLLAREMVHEEERQRLPPIDSPRVTLPYESKSETDGHISYVKIVRNRQYYLSPCDAHPSSSIYRWISELCENIARCVDENDDDFQFVQYFFYRGWHRDGGVDGSHLAGPQLIRFLLLNLRNKPRESIIKSLGLILHNAISWLGFAHDTFSQKLKSIEGCHAHEGGLICENQMYRRSDLMSRLCVNPRRYEHDYVFCTQCSQSAAAEETSPPTDDPSSTSGGSGGPPGDGGAEGSTLEEAGGQESTVSAVRLPVFPEIPHPCCVRCSRINDPEISFARTRRYEKLVLAKKERQRQAREAGKPCWTTEAGVPLKDRVTEYGLFLTRSEQLRRLVLMDIADTLEQWALWENEHGDLAGPGRLPDQRQYRNEEDIIEGDRPWRELVLLLLELARPGDWCSMRALLVAWQYCPDDADDRNEAEMACHRIFDLLSQFVEWHHDRLAFEAMRWFFEGVPSAALESGATLQREEVGYAREGEEKFRDSLCWWKGKAEEAWSLRRKEWTKHDDACAVRQVVQEFGITESVDREQRHTDRSFSSDVDIPPFPCIRDLVDFDHDLSRRSSVVKPPLSSRRLRCQAAVVKPQVMPENQRAHAESDMGEPGSAVEDVCNVSTEPEAPAQQKTAFDRYLEICAQLRDQRGKQETAEREAADQDL